MKAKRPAAAEAGRAGSRSATTLLSDAVGALSVLSFDRFHFESHLLAQGAGNETANAVRLPASGFHNLREGSAARALQQVQDLLGFAALAGAFRLSFRRFFGRLGTLLGGVGLSSPTCPWTAPHGASVRERWPAWAVPASR